MSSENQPALTEDQIKGVFGPEGAIAKGHDDYEYREGQVEMARAVVEAFHDRKHLLVEAGTGTGKTLAYLIPAIAESIHSKRRIVISTGTKNLQEQLMEKDVPFLRSILPTKFTAAYMKGRSNYACLYRVHRSADQPVLDGFDQIDHFREVLDWVRETKNGDRSELTNLPENLGFWSRINAKSDTCIGQKCPDFEPCFITQMRARAEFADILIVNHHLFFADLSIRGNQFGKVIPDYGAVIFDEAHLIEDVAADYFGSQISNYQIEELVKDASDLPIPDAVTVARIQKTAARAAGFAEQFWTRFRVGRNTDGRFSLDGGDFGGRDADISGRPDPFREAYDALVSALNRLETDIDVFSEKIPEAESLVRRIRIAKSDLDFIISQADKNFVYWLERRGRGIFLQASPVDVSGLLQEKLFDKVDTCVLTSATLSTSGNFNFLRDRLGLKAGAARSLIAPTSFDYENQAILYLPRSMPDPRSADFTDSAAAEIVKILNATKGHAFVLCTSNQSMSALYALVSESVDFPCLLQGTMSKSGLLDSFRTTGNVVLFATSSFWQGVDVRGDQLSCVIIDKLPFAVPTDPLVAARARHIEEGGGRSFFDYSVPQAIIALKQGIGRLIRSRTDRGVIAILDPRLRTKAYGREFLKSLPRMRVTGELTDIEVFLNLNKEQGGAI